MTQQIPVPMFIVVQAFMDQKSDDTVPVCIAVAHIKGISRVARKSEIIQELVEVKGQCGIDLITGRTLFVDHPMVDVCRTIGAVYVGPDLPDPVSKQVP